MDLVCVGDNVADYYPEKKMLYPGGSAFNVAVLAKRYGLETSYLGTFGTDIAGRYQCKVLETEGVDSSHIDIREGKNAISKIITQDGRSKVVEVDKGVYKEFSLSQKDFDFVQRFKYLHSTAYSYTEDYLSQFKKAGMTISYDYSFKSTKAYLKKTAPYVDIAFFSAEGIEENLEKQMLSVSKLGPEYIVFTLGEKGSLVLYNNNFYYRTAKKIKPVDTLGAGDSFIAMFLTSLIKGLAIPEILKKSTQSATKCCKRYGSLGTGRKIAEVMI